MLRDQMMRECRKVKGMTKADAQLWVYSELDRLYPPLTKPTPDTPETPEYSDSNGTLSHRQPMYSESEGGSIKGLSSIPENWPELTSNAALSAEVGWVQANRLRIVSEQAGGGASVDLSQALSPAPSWAALGWLETSIRSYAKYVDVAARATASGSDEGAVMRRERIAIDEVRALLDEMRPDGETCPACGRSPNT